MTAPVAGALQRSLRRLSSAAPAPSEVLRRLRRRSSAVEDTEAAAPLIEAATTASATQEVTDAGALSRSLRQRTSGALASLIEAATAATTTQEVAGAGAL